MYVLSCVRLTSVRKVHMIEKGRLPLWQDDGEGHPAGDKRSCASEPQHLQLLRPEHLPGPPPVQARGLHGQTPSANGHVGSGDSHQQHLANGHQVWPLSVSHQRLPILLVARKAST